MVINPASSQLIDRDWPIARGSRGVGRELPADLRGQLFRCCEVSTDARAQADSMLVIRQVPHSAAKITYFRRGKSTPWMPRIDVDDSMRQVPSTLREWPSRRARGWRRHRETPLTMSDSSENPSKRHKGRYKRVALGTISFQRPLTSRELR